MSNSFKLNFLTCGLFIIPMAQATTISCGDGCTRTEEINAETNTHIITVNGDPNKYYSNAIFLEANSYNKIINNANIHGGSSYYKISSNHTPKSVEIINNGKLLSNSGTIPEDPKHGATSSIEFYWYGIKENFSLVNRGEIGTTGSGYRERAVAVTGGTDYKLDNLGSSSFIRAKGAEAVYLDGRDIIVNNEGTILSKEGSAIHAFGNNFEIKNTGKILSEEKIPAFLVTDVGGNVHFVNSGTIKSDRDNYSVYIASGNNVTFINEEEGKLENNIKIISSDIINLINKGTIINRKFNSFINGNRVYIKNMGKIAASDLSDDAVLNIRAVTEMEFNLFPESEIEGLVLTSGWNKSLILHGTSSESNLFNGKEKYQGFEHLKMKGENWTLTDKWNFAKSTSVETGVLNLKQGSLTSQQITIAQPASLMFHDDYPLNGSVNNSGQIDFNHDEATPTFKKLTISGDYVGNDGLLKLYADLNGVNNKTDLVKIQGAASGHPRVQVKHIGKGAERKVKGVKIIETASSSDDAFNMAPLSQGAFSYRLEKRNENSQDNWYLTSYANGMPTYRPELATYANNLYAANQLFMLRLEDRLGRDHFLAQQKSQDIWLRTVYGNGQNQMSDGQNSSKIHRTLVQLGGDIVQTPQYKIGALFGTAQQHSDITGDLQSRGKVKGYGLGIYGTWLQNSEDKSGAYVDSWLQYQWFNNYVDQERYRSKGFSASLETGYHFAWQPYQVQNWTHRAGVQPQAQIVWQGVKAEQHTDQTDTTFISEGHDNIQTRLGVKLWLDSHNNSQNFNLKPYVELNWLHNSKNFAAEVEDTRDEIMGMKNLLEYKVGLETHLGKNSQFWTALSAQKGNQGFSDKQFTLGAKWLF